MFGPLLEKTHLSKAAVTIGVQPGSREKIPQICPLELGVDLTIRGLGAFIRFAPVPE